MNDFPPKYEKLGGKKLFESLKPQSLLIDYKQVLSHRKMRTCLTGAEKYSAMQRLCPLRRRRLGK